MSELKSDFIFTVCQVGAEAALKKEIGRDHPELRFAFSRPGLITFKSVQGPIAFDFVLKSVFARAYGVSLGALDATEVSKVIDLALSLKSLAPEKKIRLHVWERDRYAPGQEPLGFLTGEWMGDFENKIRSIEQGSSLFQDDPVAQVGDWVIHGVAIDPNKLNLGVSIHSVFHSPWPGGRTPISLPPEVPSRAYLKLEESLLWSKAPVRARDMAVEIGSAPGGATEALLRRGLQVCGIDPGKMDPRTLQNSNFRHIQMPVAQVLRESLPESIEWLLLDMNVEPNISLFAVDRLASRMKDSLLGVILTIKLNQWKLADDIPYMLDHVKAMGMVRVKAAQLSHHRQEIVIFGLTRKGLSRMTVSNRISG